MVNPCELEHNEDIQLRKDMIIECLECSINDCPVQKVKIKIQTLVKQKEQLTLFNILIKRDKING